MILACCCNCCKAGIQFLFGFVHLSATHSDRICGGEEVASGRIGQLAKFNHGSGLDMGKWCWFQEDLQNDSDKLFFNGSFGMVDASSQFILWRRLLSGHQFMLSEIAWISRRDLSGYLSRQSVSQILGGIEVRLSFRIGLRNVFDCTPLKNNMEPKKEPEGDVPISDMFMQALRFQRCGASQVLVVQCWSPGRPSGQANAPCPLTHHLCLFMQIYAAIQNYDKICSIWKALSRSM